MLIQAESMDLQTEIETLFAHESPFHNSENLALLARFRQSLNKGEIRVASVSGDRWQVNHWIKKGIMLHSVIGQIDYAGGVPNDGFVELDTLPRRLFNPDDQVRIPPGCHVRDGCFLAPGAICMPPAFINIGSHIGHGTIIDSHAMVGVCAQIGSNVHISSAAQIGGVIDPADRLPTIIEDEALIGGNCLLYDGVHIGRGAMLGAGTTINAQTRVYDLVRNQIYRFHPDQPLSIPSMAIVLPGSRTLSQETFPDTNQISIHVPIIIGYRDDPDLPDDLLSRYVD